MLDGLALDRESESLAEEEGLAIIDVVDRVPLTILSTELETLASVDPGSENTDEAENETTDDDDDVENETSVLASDKAVLISLGLTGVSGCPRLVDAKSVEAGMLGALNVEVSVLELSAKLEEIGLSESDALETLKPGSVELDDSIELSELVARELDILLGIVSETEEEENDRTLEIVIEVNDVTDGIPLLLLVSLAGGRESLEFAVIELSSLTEGCEMEEVKLDKAADKSTLEEVVVGRGSDVDETTLLEADDNFTASVLEGLVGSYVDDEEGKPVSEIEVESVDIDVEDMESIPESVEVRLLDVELREYESLPEVLDPSDVIADEVLAASEVIVSTAESARDTDSVNVVDPVSLDEVDPMSAEVDVETDAERGVSEPTVVEASGPL